MLSSAFEGDSGSVSLDLLTNEDLDALRQSSGLGAGPRNSQPGPSSKRYLILTYQGEFDKVHYPMALAHSETEDVGELKRTIVHLRDELDQVRRSQVDSSSVREWEQTAGSLKAEKEKLARELNEFSVENNRLVDLVESLKGDNHVLRLRVDFLESQSKRKSSNRPIGQGPPSSPMRRLGGTSRNSSFATSPANSMRRGAGGSSPYRRPPTAPSSRQQLLIGGISPISRRPPSLRSPASSTRSELIVSPRRRSPARSAAGAAPLSEVDARLQALQNFLKHQKSSVRPSVH